MTLVPVLSLDAVTLFEPDPFLAAAASELLPDVQVYAGCAQLIGLPIKLTDGKNAYGAHTFRVSGARLMAKKRVDIRVIMLLARWESEVVMRYVRETPLEGLTQAYLGAEPATECTSAWSLPAAQCDIALEQVNKLADRHEAEVVRLQKELEALVAKHNTLEAFAVPQFVVSRGGLGTVHRAAAGYQQEPPGFWRTWCAWSYSRCSFLRMAAVDHLPSERKCARCFKGMLNSH